MRLKTVEDTKRRGHRIINEWISSGSVEEKAVNNLSGRILHDDEDCFLFMKIGIHVVFIYFYHILLF